MFFCVQAMWKGYQTRKSSDPEVREIRSRTITAGLNVAPDKTLGHLRDQAVQMLSSDNPTLSQILHALRDLGELQLCWVFFVCT